MTADVLAGRPGRLHDVPGLRRGRAPLRARAPGHARGAAPRRPRDRADRRGRRARAAAVRARRALRPRPEPGRDVPPALRRRRWRTSSTRHASGEVRAEAARQRRGPGVLQRERRRGRVARHGRSATRVRTAAGKRLDEPEAPGSRRTSSVMASGNLGLISFPREPGRVTLEQIEERRPGLLDALRTHPGIAFVLVRSEHHGPVVLGADGQRLLRDDRVEGVDPLAPFGPFAADHVRRTDGFAHCPDIVVNGTYWEELEEVAAFEELVGLARRPRRRAGAPVRAAPARPAVAGRAGRRRGERAPRSCAAGCRARAGRPTRVERRRRARASPTRVGGRQLGDVTRRTRSGGSTSSSVPAACRSAGTCPSGSGSRSAARPARPPWPRPRDRGGRGRATGPSPRSGSARRRPRRAGRAMPSSMSVSPGEPDAVDDEAERVELERARAGAARRRARRGRRGRRCPDLTVSPAVTSRDRAEASSRRAAARRRPARRPWCRRREPSQRRACRGGRGAGARPARRRAGRGAPGRVRGGAGARPAPQHGVGQQPRAGRLEQHRGVPEPGDRHPARAQCSSQQPVRPPGGRSSPGTDDHRPLHAVATNARRRRADDDLRRPPPGRARVRVLHFPEPRRLDVWCRAHGVGEAIVGGFFVRDPYRALGELWSAGRRVAFEPVAEPYAQRRACVLGDGPVVRLAALARRPGAAARRPRPGRSAARRRRRGRVRRRRGPRRLLRGRGPVRLRHHRRAPSARGARGRGRRA